VNLAENMLICLWLFRAVDPGFVFFAVFIVALLCQNLLSRRFRRKHVTAFATQVGLTYNGSRLPAGVPYPPQGGFWWYGSPRDFVYGRRDGYQVFSCEYYTPGARYRWYGSVIGIHAILRDQSSFTTSKISSTTKDGWTFAMGSSGWISSGLRERDVIALWDKMILKAREEAPTIAKTD
jgi:hypothetical protein